MLLRPNDQQNFKEYVKKSLLTLIQSWKLSSSLPNLPVFPPTSIYFSSLFQAWNTFRYYLLSYRSWLPEIYVRPSWESRESQLFYTFLNECMELLPSSEGKVCARGISWKNYIEAKDAMVHHIHRKIR